MTFDTDDFARDVIERSSTIPVLVDFWAAWCGPCRVLGPILEKLANEHEGEWALAKLDTEAHPQIAAQYGIRSIPNVKLFIDGQVSDEFVGALPEPRVVEWLGKAIPSRYRAQLAGARQLLSDHGAAQALEMLRPIVAAEPDNDEALVLLARAVLHSDPDEAGRSVESIQLGSRHFEEADGIKALVAMFARIDGPQSVPEDPVRDDYLRAMSKARSGDFEAALEAFIGVVRRNRYYDEDGARKACIAVFNLLGDDHEATKQFRSSLSSALY